ncbi:NAD(P)H-binding protein [Rhodococcus aerolatus]
MTGSSGYVGSRLVTALARAGHDVTATARSTTKLDRFDWPSSVTRAELDVSDADSCAAALAGPAEVAYFLVHSIGEGDFARHDLDSARTFARAARRAGVRRIVYLGGFVPRHEHLSEHLESRADVGDALGDEPGVELVELRAAIILGAGSTSFELIRHLVERLPVIPLPRWMDHPVSPVAVDDVLHYLVAAADPERVPAGAYDVSNGESPTYSALIRSYARARGRRRVWVPVPAVPPALVARVVSWLTPLPHELTADLVMSLPNTMASNDTRIRDLVPDPEAGLTTIGQAWERIAAGTEPTGTSASSDPLQLSTTDPDWAQHR